MSQKIGGKTDVEGVVNPKKMCHVFWDYENCRKPRDVSFEESYKALRDTLGAINMTMRQLSVYCDETLLEAGGRQTLNDLGCSVINPSKVDPRMNKKKETSDLRMAVDMSMYAFDQAASPESCAIVLISSDSDFGHLLAQLRSRSYEIVLICNRNAPERLTAHANRCIRVYDLFVQTEQVGQEPTAPIKSPSPPVPPSPELPPMQSMTLKPAASIQTVSFKPSSPIRTVPAARPPSPDQSWPVITKPRGTATYALPPPALTQAFPQPLSAALPLNAYRSAGAMNYFSVLDEEDDSTIGSQQREQNELRVNDLVALVADLMRKNGGCPVYDANVGNAFKKMYPALAAKQLYKPTKFAALESGKLVLSEEQFVYGAPPSHLLSVPRR